MTYVATSQHLAKATEVLLTLATRGEMATSRKGAALALRTMRAPFQVLVFPFRLTAPPAYAIFQRSHSTRGYWQGIAGGGKSGETPLEAARREAEEEAGIPPTARFIQLASLATVPAIHFQRVGWSNDILSVPEYAFGVETDAAAVRTSDEHDAFRWVSFDDAARLLKWDSNRNALWELNERLLRGLGSHSRAIDPAGFQS